MLASGDPVPAKQGRSACGNFSSWTKFGREGDIRRRQWRSTRNHACIEEPRPQPTPFERVGPHVQCGRLIRGHEPAPSHPTESPADKGAWRANAGRCSITVGVLPMKVTSKGFSYRGSCRGVGSRSHHPRPTAHPHTLSYGATFVPTATMTRTPVG